MTINTVSGFKIRRYGAYVQNVHYNATIELKLFLAGGRSHIE